MIRSIFIGSTVSLVLCAAPYASGETDQEEREERIAARKELIDLSLSFSTDALVESIRQNDDIAFDLLLRAGIDVNVATGGHLPLVVAAEEGRTQMAEALLDAGAAADGRDERGNTALLVAAGKRNTRLALALIEQGANPNERNNEGTSALHTPGNMDIVSALLKAGANVDSRDHDGVTPLWRAAVVHRHTGLVKELLGAGADPHVMQNGIPAWTRALDGGNDEIAELLIVAGAEVNWRDDEGNTRLYLAANDGDIPRVRRLVDLGADPHIPGEWGTPLFHVANDGNLNMVQALVEVGAVETEHCELAGAIWSYGQKCGLRDCNGPLVKRSRAIIRLIAQVANRRTDCVERTVAQAERVESLTRDKEIRNILVAAGYSPR